MDRKDTDDDIEAVETEQDREGKSVVPDDSKYEEVQQADECDVKTTDATAEKETLNSVKEEKDIPADTQERDKTEEKATVPRLAGTILASREANSGTTRKASSIKSAGSRRRKKKATAFSIVMRILIGIAVVLLSCVCILLFMRIHGQASMTPKPEDVKIAIPEIEDSEDSENPEAPKGIEKVEDDGKTVTYKGHKYRWNDKITTFLVMGTDRTVEQQESGMTVAGANGQADSILLGVVDNTNKKISFININRDTFIPVAEYTSNGEYVGDKKMQICLSYAYGKDDETSCRYTAEAVSKFLYGMPVNYYTRISYDAIPVLNDSVGGVTITIPEDLTAIDAAFEKGATLTLNGSQALRFVRWRNIKIVNTNEERISHQKQYMYAFMKQTMNATRSDYALPLGLYSAVRPYMTTNVSVSHITYLTSKALEYGISGDSIRSIPGKSVAGAGNHIEFYPDETGLYEIVLDTFYNRVD
ncbi:MAG: LCP family protein [Lachnospiraceae bacterium]|nr:LCP family protein [Lachnospiraceae bacterium]